MNDYQSTAQNIQIITANGLAGNDTFLIAPTALVPIVINGGAPSLTGGNDVPPGDILALNLTRVADAAVPAHATDGVVTSTSHQDVTFTGIETLIASDRFELNDTQMDATALGVVGRDSSDGILTDGLGLLEVTLEPLVDALYDITVEIEDLAGNVTMFDVDLNSEAPTDIEVDTLAPNLPFLDLLTDTGRHEHDNITNINTPTVSLTTEDRTANPTEYDHKLANNLKYRIFDRAENAAESLVFDSFAAFGDFVSANQLTATLPTLVDGYHNLKLEVEDRAGNISNVYLLDILVDTVAPEKSFGDREVPNDGLHPVSDSGVRGPGNETTFVDRITNDTTPTLWGRAEANSVIRAFVVDNNGALARIGQTVALPRDGDDNRRTEFIPFHPHGHWELTSTINMNDPRLGFASIDGMRRLFVTAEDVAGNQIPIVQDELEGLSEMFLDIVIDTQGPRVIDPDKGGHLQAIQVITKGVAKPTFNLFDVTPANNPNQGPTPLVDGLLINVEDLPLRMEHFLYDALQTGTDGNPAESIGNYAVVGDRVGVITIKSVEVTNIEPYPGWPATAMIRINFAKSLPDDRYTLTINDGLVDPAGNQFDGESNIAAPNETPAFPSGDGQPGGNFTVRFTVDTRPEIGQWGENQVAIDINGNGVWDPEVTGDENNHDLVFQFGEYTDYRFAGNFAAPGAAGASGFDKLGAYGFTNGTYRFLLDYNHDGVPDVSPRSLPINGIPVAGNFTNDHPGDEVGLFDGTTWWLDRNGNNTIDGPDVQVRNGQRGHPIVGDFDGDGSDDLDDRFVSPSPVTLARSASEGRQHVDINRSLACASG